MLLTVQILYTNGNGTYHSVPILTVLVSTDKEHSVDSVWMAIAYSYEFKCIRCDSELENWGLYIVFAFLPLTVFIVIILVFRINVTSPKLYMYVYAAQTLSILQMFLLLDLFSFPQWH